MQMGMGYTLRQKISLECSMCKQPMDSEKQQETRRSAAIFGSVPYAVCPVCNQEVSKEMQTEEYCRQWNIRWGKHIIHECFEAFKKAKGIQR